jgi:hypothetical protein
MDFHLETAPSLHTGKIKLYIGHDELAELSIIRPDFRILTLAGFKADVLFENVSTG